MPVLTQLGLTPDESRRNVLKLSGGQQQRVAIARVLASSAPVILADEPTGNLDDETAAEITAILRNAAREHGRCVVVVSHSNEVANQADVIVSLSDRRALPLV
jgi:putative ABC transport system ATP-binding protein